MQPGLVSVMMPAYNAEVFIGDSIESVLRQEYSNWELIVIDDGSTDRTPEILRRYSDPRIRRYRQENGGEAAARNAALERMEGEFLAFLDADDLFLPNHVSAAVEYLRSHPEHDGVYTDGYHMDGQGRRLDRISRYRRGPFEGRVFEEVVRASDVFGPPLCMVLRAKPILENRMRYDPAVGLGTDWDFNTRLAEIAAFGRVGQPTCLYRIHRENITLTTSEERRAHGQIMCREKAILRPAFRTCSLPVRSYAFFDLLVNLLPGHPERQAAITRWPQFAELPDGARARLMRLMAGRALLRGENSQYVAEWFQSARALDPDSFRNRLTAAAYAVSPVLCRLLLQARQLAQPGGRTQTAFNELGGVRESGMV